MVGFATTPTGKAAMQCSIVSFSTDQETTRDGALWVFCNQIFIFDITPIYDRYFTHEG